MLSPVALISLLDREVYLYAEVDRIVGLRSGTARRWINGYERGGKSYAPILRTQPRDSEWVTWGEFVEARILAELRERAAGWQPGMPQHVMNLTLLPLTPTDSLLLEEQLGRGRVVVLSPPALSLRRRLTPALAEGGW